MPFNLPGALVPFHLLINPRLVIPSLIVKDIRQLDFLELRRAGYRGAVFDKDNCLTRPHKDELVPELQDAWNECRQAFGDNNVLIVSNSAGTLLDPAEIQAESVSYYLSVPVLRHKVFKPSYSCISAVRTYFSSLPAPVGSDELVVVGDRLFTDVVLANRMARRVPVSPEDSSAEKKTDDIAVTTTTKKRSGPLSVWTSGVWEKESMLMRALEKGVLKGIQRYIAADNGLHNPAELERFVKEPSPPPPEPKDSLPRRLWKSLGSKVY